MAEEQRRIPSFVDFDIELETRDAQNREYSLSVRSLSGEAHEIMKFPFTDAELDSSLKDIQIALLRSASPGRLALSDDARVVQNFGRVLFDALMVGNVRSTFTMSQVMAHDQEKGLRLKLRINAPELAWLPWEFLYDSRQSEFICLSRNTPLVRYIDVPLPVNPILSKLPLRILGMVASPADKTPLKVSAEKKRVNDALAPLQESGQVELVWLDGGTWQDLFNAMEAGPWHIFHFIGHGGYDRANDEGTVLFESQDGSSDPMRATQLARLLADHESMRLVVMNSCEGARGGREDLFSSSASILVRRGIPAVLAMQYEISDAAAIAFSSYFYKALAEGTPVDAAVSGARIALSLQLDDTLEWVTPVLYLRAPDGVLFQIDRTARRALPQKTDAPPAPAPDVQAPSAAPATAPTPTPLPVVRAAAPASGALQKTVEAPGQPPQKAARPASKYNIPLIAGGLVLFAVCGCLLIVLLNSLVVNSTATPTPHPTTRPRIEVTYVPLASTDTPTPAVIATTSIPPTPVPATPVPATIIVRPTFIRLTPVPITSIPVSVVSSYWKFYGQRDYANAWNFLSANYRQSNFQSDLKKYIAQQTVRYCSVSLQDARVITTTPQNVYVLARVVFKTGSDCVEAPNLLLHQVTLSNSVWSIEHVMNVIAPDSSCASASKRLSVGIYAQVTTQSDSLLMHAYPASTDRSYIFDSLAPNTQVPVLDGPLCAKYNNIYTWWWKVRSPRGMDGWVVEGGDTTDPIFIQPAP